MRGKTLLITLAVLVVLFAIAYRLTTDAEAGLLADPISQVRNGTIPQYPDLPVGKAFTASFDGPRWWRGKSDLVTYVDFRGRLKASEIKKSEAGYQACVARIKEADGDLGAIKTCGPEELFAVQFDFIFSPLDDRAFRLRYIDMAPWRRMGLLDEKAVLKYVFEQR
jgi:hypothetical protein